MAEADITVWAEALRASTHAHRQEIDVLMPWASLLPPARLAGGEATVLLATTPTLAALPAHCEAISRLLANSPQGRGPRALDGRAGTIRRRCPIAVASPRGDGRSRENHVRQPWNSASCSMPAANSCPSDTATAMAALDANFYDLLASEARLASFIAIAKGDLPAKHWFRLGRTLTPIDGNSGLISWSGSMFEYLMPSLVMRAPAGSLLDETNRLVVWRQEKYGDGLGVPWGMSESEYNVRDIEQTYQYSSFGIPDLAYKRGLGENTVVAPYASGLAAMIDPTAAARNFQRMAEIGACGVYGWYEALDYTRARLPEGTKVAIIRAYMAHHQGNDDRRYRERASGRPDAHAVSRRTDHACGRTSAAGAHAPRCRCRQGAGGTASAAAQNASLGARRSAPLCLGAFARAAHASSVEWTLFDDDHGGGIGIQPVARYRDHPLARGRHLRRLGRLHLPARCAHGQHLVGRLSAKRGGTRQL